MTASGGWTEEFKLDFSEARMFIADKELAFKYFCSNIIYNDSIINSRCNKLFSQVVVV